MKQERALGVSALVALTALVLTVSGCAGLTPGEVDAFLHGIPTEIPDLSDVADGSYHASYRIDPPRGETAFLKNVGVSVAVAGHRVAAVEITDPGALAGDPEFVAYADRVVEAGTLAVDGVSGATYSSKAFAKAVEIALLEAGGWLSR